MSKTNSPISLMKELNLLSWDSLIVGFDHGWLTERDIGAFAVNQLLTDAPDPNSYIAILAGAETLRSDEIRAYLNRIERELNNGLIGDRALELKQWRLVLLIAATRQGYSPEELLDRVEEIYVEFGYPKDMWLTSRYNTTEQDRKNLKIGRLAHDPLTALSELIEALKIELVAGYSTASH